MSDAFTGQLTYRLYENLVAEHWVCDVFAWDTLWQTHRLVLREGGPTALEALSRALHEIEARRAQEGQAQ